MARSNDQGDVTTIADLQQQQVPRLPEVEVDAIVPLRDPVQSADRVIIRMNTTLEDFTYGNPTIHYKMEAGKRYEVARHIAQYLDGLGYLWH